MTQSHLTGDGPVDVSHPDWYLAYSLSERLGAGAPVGPVDEERGRLRLRRWREEPVFAGDSELFDSWLRALGLDEPALVRVLGEMPETVRSRFADVPDHVRTIERAWRDHRPGGTAADQEHHHHDHEHDHDHEHRHDPHPHAAFVELVRPLVDDGLRRVRAAVREACAAAPGPHVDADLLADQLCDPPTAAINLLVGRVLVLELNVLRVQGQLTGHTPQERFQDFTRRLRDPKYALDVLMEYPVLARDATVLVDNWVDARVEFARRLVADQAALADRLGDPAGLGAVTGVSFGAGDSHRGGRSVGFVRFANGARAVYKPRGLQVELHFQQLLDWLNDRGAQPPLRTMWVLDRGEYGWSEFVAAGPCADQEALRRFYTRQGGYLALLHSLAAVDFHLENVIAAGEHPMLVDLEALFHPDSEHTDRQVGVSVESFRTMRESVLEVGLLPRPIIYQDDDGIGGVDFSGLAGTAGQLTPAPVATWEESGTDRMRLVRKRIEMGGGQNLPSLDGATHHTLDFSDDILAGFDRTYRLLHRHRDDLLAPDGPVAAFAGDEVRVILRATRTYGNLLQESRHPDLLRNALDRERFLSFLWLQEDWPGAETRIAAAEQAQLSRGDIPIFGTTPASRDFVAGDGTVIADVLTTSGLDRSRQRIGGLSEAHLAQQTWILRSSLAALTMGVESQGQWSQYRVTAATTPAPADRFLAAARAAGDRLLLTADAGDDSLAWLGHTLVADRIWQLGPVGIDLYNGLSGIALFLGHLGEVTGEQRFRAAAEVVATMLTRQVDLLDETPKANLEKFTVGAFNELGGPLYALSHLGALWRREDLLDAAERIVPVLLHLAPADDAYDVISGSAGAILGLLALHAARPSPHLLDAAGTFAAILRAKAEPAGDGIGWAGSVNPSRPLAGFSHGGSGIAVALARLDRVLGHRDHLPLVEGAIRYERSAFDPEQTCWLDLRDTTPDGYSMIAWCHGGPGIALARADLAGYVDDREPVERDLRDALAGMLRFGLTGEVITGTGNHSICHGDLGNIEAVLAAARVLGDAAAARQAELVAASILDYIDQDGWLCGVPLGAETPGLMSGIAGIGYNLLRLAAPDRVPSVLLVEPPRPAGERDNRG
ncbi:type 2 lanthipeptide synthetase LanM family protein [Micromonospora sp. WMMD1128]|uniref:type 2 lanthipeptide synthetase LanM family protein n=1 Tax=Micromonospora sp. WMMD1128 TaxID=3015150 RepID=UPI00248CFDA4|nr:type 2 lanthipeptide synthetase LanM family protein [Micromonospora sp. WMMD1128]WBB76087.1 type 2 lanthipeptide synthetase LanM family protein [Micromonospora sp. WMMD1128]